jgi:hypothetical protein
MESGISTFSPYAAVSVDPGKVRAKQTKKGKVQAKPVWIKNIQNKATKSVFIIITLHNYGKLSQF